MITLAISLASIYAAGMVVLALAVSRSARSRRKEFRPAVSVIIAARNEEARIRDCLESVSRLNYPEELLEVIVVDDNSTDCTADIISQFNNDYPFIRCIEANKPSDQLQGKVNALVTGIERSSGEILMFTDADCTVPENWVRRTVSYYTGEEVVLVAGFSSVSSNDWFSSVQALDWLMLVSAASAYATLHSPATAVGNNFSLRRSAYDEVGGYRNIPFNVTEDLSLFQSVTSTRKSGALLPLDPETTIRTGACSSWKELYLQRKRWFVGGKQLNRTASFAAVWLFNLVIATGFLYFDTDVWIGLLLTKTAGDFFLVLPSVNALRRRSLLIYWLPFQLFYTLYLLVLPVITVFDDSVRWKEREFASSSTRPTKEKPSPIQEEGSSIRS